MDPTIRGKAYLLIIGSLSHVEVNATSSATNWKQDHVAPLGDQNQSILCFIDQVY